MDRAEESRALLCYCHFLEPKCRIYRKLSLWSREPKQIIHLKVDSVEESLTIT
jgi:hypothetical protein